MNKDLEKELINEFPTFFKDMYGDMTKTCMHWGCSCGKGWFKIIRKACRKVAKLDKGTFYFLQIKEKWGRLCLYCTGGNEEIYKIMLKAEEESCKTCEKCGTKKDVTAEGSWIATLCSVCRKSLTK